MALRRAAWGEEPSQSFLAELAQAVSQVVLGEHAAVLCQQLADARSGLPVSEQRLDRLLVAPRAAVPRRFLLRPRERRPLAALDGFQQRRH